MRYLTRFHAWAYGSGDQRSSDLMSCERWTRRLLLGAAGASRLLSAAIGSGEHTVSAGESGTKPATADQALEALRAGNRRFAEQKPIHAHQAADWRAHLTSGQQPIATILACSDSRVPPELVFDQGFGDLFVIRVAGNIIDNDVVGSIEYAMRHLQTHLVVVMGHQGCGAVTAALQAIDGRGSEPKYIARLLKHITPGIKALDPGLSGEARLSAAVEANVKASMGLLSVIPEGREVFAKKEFRLVGAVYELGSGRVRFLD
jgi:carbonic anhydrase